MCLTSMGDQTLTPEQKMNKFDEMVRRLGNQTICYDVNRYRRTKSELCLINGTHRTKTTDPFQEEFFVTEILTDDAKQIYINENDAKSEEFVM